MFAGKKLVLESVDVELSGMAEAILKPPDASRGTVNLLQKTICWILKQRKKEQAAHRDNQTQELLRKLLMESSDAAAISVVPVENSVSRAGRGRLTIVGWVLMCRFWVRERLCRIRVCLLVRASKLVRSSRFWKRILAVVVGCLERGFWISDRRMHGWIRMRDLNGKDVRCL